MSVHEPQRQTTPITTANSLVDVTMPALASRTEQDQTPLPTATPTRQSRDDGDGDIEQKRKRQRQPRNSACQTCAGLKMKCVASSMPGAFGKCERCHRMQRECIASIPKPRKRRTQSGHGQMSPDGKRHQDQPLADLLSHQTQAEPASPQAHPIPFKAPQVQNAAKEALMARHDLSHNGSVSFRALLAHGLALDHASDHLLEGVDYTFVQTSITIFRRISVQFPFLLLRPDTNAISMTSYRPITTLAVCIVGAAAMPRIQRSLVQAFRRSLSSRVLIAGESDLDLLIGLLTFTAWHHHYISTAQLYQDLCLLTGLATDLGLYRSQFRTFGPGAPDLECQRAFLGSYYLCTGLSIMALGRPSPMRWTKSLHDCARTVSQFTPELKHVVGLLEAIHLVEEFDEVLRSDAGRADRAASRYVELQARNMLQRQKALTREHPHLATTFIGRAISCHFYQSLLTSTGTSDTRLLIQCACTVKEHFDHILARPSVTIHHVDILDYTTLLSTLLLLERVFLFSRTLTKADANGWEFGTVSSMLQIEPIITALLDHVDRANENDDLAPRSEQAFTRLRTVCDAVRRHSSLAAAHTQSSVSTAAGRAAEVTTEHALAGFRPVNSVTLNGSAEGVGGSATATAPPLPLTEDYTWGLLDDTFWHDIAGQNVRT